MRGSRRSLAAAVAAMIFAIATLGASKEKSVIEHLRQLLPHDSWAHDVSRGRIAIETRILVFAENGTVRERIYDDTGIHDLEGRWSLESSDASVFLVLSGDNLRDHGRFIVTLAADENAFELGAGDAALQFQRRRSGR